MTTQPKALRLADALEHQVYRGSYDWERVEPMMLKAAAELRRLHAENETLKTERDELLEALKELLETTGINGEFADSARAAIAKAEGEQK